MTYSYTVKNMDNFKKETISMLIKLCLKKRKNFLFTTSSKGREVKIALNLPNV